MQEKGKVQTALWRPEGLPWTIFERFMQRKQFGRKNSELDAEQEERREGRYSSGCPLLSRFGVPASLKFISTCGVHDVFFNNILLSKMIFISNTHK